MIRINRLTLTVEDVVKGREIEKLKEKASRRIKVPVSMLQNMLIVKKSLDSRDKPFLKYVYTVDIPLPDETKAFMGKDVAFSTPYVYAAPKLQRLPRTRPVIAGSGPAGLFAGLILSEAGCRPIIFERGKDVDSRKKDVELFWQTGVLNENSNVQFGEGGAGTFSDGKLTTGIKDRRIHKVISEFMACGAPPEIAYMAKPHIGTDRLTDVVKNMRRKIIDLGGEVRFEHQFIDFNNRNGRVASVAVRHNGQIDEFETEWLILALGHSARDTAAMLFEKGVDMCAKPFAVGVRIEHSQAMINACQYGGNANSRALGSADYKLSVHLPNDRGVYTFCMCPGGVVVAAASEANRLVTNGMSNFSRDAANANAALLVSVRPDDFPNGQPLAGIDFQRRLEERAFQLGGGRYNAPAQLVGDFLAGRVTRAFGDITPSYTPNVTTCDLRECFEGYDFIWQNLQSGLLAFDKKIKGFARHDAVLTGVESRSSSPVLIKRNQNDCQCNIAGVLPCGEGAGHAGGIISAAVDGIRCAEAVLNGCR